MWPEVSILYSAVACRRILYNREHFFPTKSRSVIDIVSRRNENVVHDGMIISQSHRLAWDGGLQLGWWLEWWTATGLVGWIAVVWHNKISVQCDDLIVMHSNPANCNTFESNMSVRMRACRYRYRYRKT